MNIMSNWKYHGELCGIINYIKGDEWLRLLAEFDKKTRSITISQARWESNGTPVMVPQNHPTRYSTRYGYFQNECPTLGLEDVKWIVSKAEELFTEEGMANE